MIIAPIKTKSRHDINMMAAAGQIVGEVLQLLAETVKPGMSTLELDDIAEAYIRKNGAIPTFKATTTSLRPSASRSMKKWFTAFQMLTRF